MIIRPIHSGETDLVAGLFNQYRVFYEQASDPVLAAAYILERLEQQESRIFVALLEGVPVGFAQLYPAWSSISAEKNWVLNDLFVLAEYRSQRIGRALTEAAIRFAREDGAGSLTLETAVHNLIAQRLYEKMGFRRQSPDFGFYTYRISLEVKKGVNCAD